MDHRRLIEIVVSFFSPLYRGGIDKSDRGDILGITRASWCCQIYPLKPTHSIMEAQDFPIKYDSIFIFMKIYGRHLWLPTMHLAAFQVVLVVNNPPAQAGDVRVSGSIPGSGKSPGGGHGNLLQYSCLENPMDRGAWRATVHRVTRRVRHDWRDFTHTACIWPLSKSAVTQLCPTLCDTMDC